MLEYRIELRQVSYLQRLATLEALTNKHARRDKTSNDTDCKILKPEHVDYGLLASGTLR